MRDNDYVYARLLSLCCHSGLLFAEKKDLFGLVEGFGIPDFLIVKTKLTSDDETVSDIGVGLFDKVSGGTELERYS